MSELLSPAPATTPPENDPTADAYARDLYGLDRLEAPADPSHMPGTCTTDQHSQISALLLEREPVVTAESIAAFVSEVLGIPYGPRDMLWALSGQQAGKLLLALEAQRTTFGKHHRTGRHRTPCHAPDGKAGIVIKTDLPERGLLAHVLSIAGEVVRGER